MPFTDIIGNNKIKQILKNYLNKERIPYSMIFSGPQSANLSDLALGFAKSVNCERDKDDFCDSCDHCADINKTIFPDVIYLVPDGQFYKKDQIIELIEENYKRPLVSDKKIFIISDANKMNESSSNSFLKVLEEPSDSTIFILFTRNKSQLLPTIRSRCQILNFYSPSKKEIHDHLIKMGYDTEKADLLASISRSSIDNVLKEDFYSLQNKRSRYLEILEKLLKKKQIDEVLLALSDQSRSRSVFIDSFGEMINLISLMLRDIMIIKIELKKEFLINIDFSEKLFELQKYITLEKILYLIRRMEFLQRDIKRNLNSKILILEFINSYV